MASHSLSYSRYDRLSSRESAVIICIETYGGIRNVNREKEQ